MKCPKCNTVVKADQYAYQCRCGRVPKVIAKRKILPHELTQLLKDGITSPLSGFTSKAGKPFSARLQLQKGKVVFQFSSRANPRGLSIRVQSFHSGTATFYIDGPLSRSADLSFGLVPSRLAECLALITAIQCAQHYLDCSELHVSISMNNRDLSRYLLRERTPRDREARRIITRAQKLLGVFASWRAEYKPRRRPRLHGGSGNIKFPRGAFPWLSVDMVNVGDTVEVRLPDDPAVTANFRASIQTASCEGPVCRVPAAAAKVARAWIGIVKDSNF